jgi:hypothetical protein
MGTRPWHKNYLLTTLFRHEDREARPDRLHQDATAFNHCGADEALPPDRKTCQFTLKTGLCFDRP